MTPIGRVAEGDAIRGGGLVGGTVGLGVALTPIGCVAEDDAIGGCDAIVATAVSAGGGESAIVGVGVEIVGGIGSGASA